MSKGNEGKKEVRHVKKFMGGAATPQEIHRKYGIRKRCETCGSPAAVRIRVLVQLDELVKRNPEFVAQIMATNPAGVSVPTIQTKYGPMVKVSDIGACERCRAEAERAAAHGPSWALVEIDRGPDDKVAVSVPANLVAKG